MGKILLNVHFDLCYFTVLLGKLFVQPEWNPDSLVLMTMIGNCQKEIGVIQAALLKFNTMLKFTWLHSWDCTSAKRFLRQLVRHDFDWFLKGSKDLPKHQHWPVLTNRMIQLGCTAKNWLCACVRIVSNRENILCLVFPLHARSVQV